MSTRRGPPCTICAAPGVRRIVDGSLEERVSASGINRQLAEMFPGAHTVPSAETILRHKRHYAPEPSRARMERKHDFAVKVRDRMSAALDSMPPVEDADGVVTDPIMLKDFAPSLTVGLRAQGIIDKREVAAKKNTQADILVAMLRALRGEGTPVALLEDGNTIEGTAVALD